MLNPAVAVAIPAPSHIIGHDRANSRLGPRKWDLRATLAPSLTATCIVLLVLFAVFVRYTEESTDEHVNQYFLWYLGVALMVFIGFGYLMTFLQRYSYSAVALNFLASIIVMLEFIIIGGAVQQTIFDTEEKKIKLDLPLLIDAEFAAASGMIAFGAIIGKCSPTQLVWLMILQVPVYAFNQHLVFKTLKALDIGGSISIHIFGAYYGLAASWIMSRRPGSGIDHPKNRANYVSDMTAMIGTLFLWMFWPAFNGALASVSPAVLDSSPTTSQTQFFCVVNTIISLCGSVVTTFLTSSLLGNKLNMVHIQNATLAGGVAMGAACNLRIMPAGALAVGLSAGVISTAGFAYLTPFLERTIGLLDTCGVHNLHGMPGIIGGLAALIASAVAYDDNRGVLDELHGSKEPGFQLAAIAATVGIGMGAGLLMGAVVRWFSGPVPQELPVALMYEDDVFWGDEFPASGTHWHGVHDASYAGGSRSNRSTHNMGANRSVHNKANKSNHNNSGLYDASSTLEGTQHPRHLDYSVGHPVPALAVPALPADGAAAAGGSGIMQHGK